jgi:multiple sugar transport system permease protein
MAGQSGWKRFLWAMLFIAPSLIGLAIFTLLPMGATFVLSFFDWDMLTAPKFIGLGNFNRLVGDKVFLEAFIHTLLFIVGYIPLVGIVSLAVAMVLNQKLAGKKFFRMTFFLPVVSGWVTVSLLWMWIFNPKFGILNYALSLVGIQGPAWLYDPNWAMAAIILASVWKDIGYFMIIFLSGLQDIPEEYYEASMIDGANAWQKFSRITLPLLSPTTFFVVMIATINSFQVFDQVRVMTNGGPGGATTVMVAEIVRNAFDFSRMGYASAMACALFVVVLLITYFQNWFQKNWVFYE